MVLETPQKVLTTVRFFQKHCVSASKKGVVLATAPKHYVSASKKGWFWKLPIQYDKFFKKLIFPHRKKGGFGNWSKKLIFPVISGVVLATAQKQYVFASKKGWFWQLLKNTLNCYGDLLVPTAPRHEAPARL